MYREKIFVSIYTAYIGPFPPVCGYFGLGRYRWIPCALYQVDLYPTPTPGVWCWIQIDLVQRPWWWIHLLYYLSLYPIQRKVPMKPRQHFWANIIWSSIGFLWVEIAIIKLLNSLVSKQGITRRENSEWQTKLAQDLNGGDKKKSNVNINKRISRSRYC